MDTADCTASASTAILPPPSIVYNSSNQNAQHQSPSNEMWQVPSNSPSSSSTTSNSQVSTQSQSHKLNGNQPQSNQSPSMCQSTSPMASTNNSLRIQYQPQQQCQDSKIKSPINDPSNNLSSSIDPTSSIEQNESRPVIPDSSQDPSSNVFSQPLYVRWMYTAVSAPVFHPSTHFSQHESAAAGYLHHQPQWQHESHHQSSSPQINPNKPPLCMERSPQMALSDMGFSVQTSPAILPSLRSQSFSFPHNSRPTHPQQQQQQQPQYMAQRKSISSRINPQNNIHLQSCDQQKMQIPHPRQIAQHYHQQTQQKCSPISGLSQKPHIQNSPHPRQPQMHPSHVGFPTSMHADPHHQTSSSQDQLLCLNSSPSQMSRPSSKSSRRNLITSDRSSSSAHTTPRSFSCYVDTCKKSYSTGAGLRYHLKTFHNTITPRAASIKAKSRTFCCPECPLKAFSTAAGLRYHCKTVHS